MYLTIQKQKLAPLRPFVRNSARMSTFSLLNYETGEEKLFFDLDIPREKRYYYGVPEKTLQTDGTLLKKIRESN